jgi:hypothetical protein
MFMNFTNRKETAISKCGIQHIQEKRKLCTEATGLTKSNTAIAICSIKLETESTSSKVFKVERRSKIFQTAK